MELSNSRDFSGRVCVVTGAANGIGRCIAQEFIAQGAQVYAIDVDEAAGRTLAARWPDKYIFYRCDIADGSALEAIAQEIIARAGHIDFLINDACISRRGIISGCSGDDFNYVLRIGVTAPYLLSKAFDGCFAPGAAIVNICSTRAFMSQRDTESYSAAKGGIFALTHALSASLAGRVRVNCISPGWIDVGAYHGDGSYEPHYTAADTAQHPAGRVGTPVDIASMALFLCSDRAGFISGQNFTVDGGMTRLMIYADDCGWSYDPEG